MGHRICPLCKDNWVLVDFGPVCRQCLDRADPKTKDGAILHAYMAAENSDSCDSAESVIIDLLRPFALSEQKT